MDVLEAIAIRWEMKFDEADAAGMCPFFCGELVQEYI